MKTKKEVRENLNGSKNLNFERTSKIGENENYRIHL